MERKENGMHDVLIVGGGSIGERHLRCFIRTGRVRASICEQRPERLQQLARAYPIASAHTDFEKLDLAGYDAVVICVYANLHVPYAARAVQAGAHVLVEKPLSVDLKGVDELVALAEEKRVVVGVAHVRRAMTTSMVVKRALDEGRIGDVLDLTWTVGYDHRQARPDYRSTYWRSRSMGGGAVLDMSSHTSNLVQWFLGPARSVMALYDHLQIEDTDCEDTLSYILRFRDNAAVATIHCVAWQAHRADLLTLSGTRGSIVCDAHEGRVGIVDRSGNWTWTEGLKPKPDSKGQVDEPFVCQANNFLDAIEGKARILCDVADARHTMEICEATYESGRRRAEVPIPLSDPRAPAGRAIPT